MTTESAREQVRRFLDYMHPQIVDFAQESYAIQGRGAIRIEVPDLRAGSSATSLFELDDVSDRRRAAAP